MQENAKVMDTPVKSSIGERSLQAMVLAFTVGFVVAGDGGGGKCRTGQPLRQADRRRPGLSPASVRDRAPVFQYSE